MGLYEYYTCDNAKDLLNSIMEDSSQYGIIATDENDCVILWNKGAEIIYGYAANELLGKKKLIDLHIKDAINTDILFLIRSSDKSEINDYEVDAKRKDGTKITVSVSASPRFDKNKNQTGLLLIVKDLTTNILQNHYRDVLMETTYIVNIATNINTMLESILSKIKMFLGVTSAYICLYDNYTKNFKITSKIGVLDSFEHNQCNFGNRIEELPENMQGCYESATQFVIQSQNAKNHIMYNAIENKNSTKTELSIIHIPLLSDITLLGMLHIIVSEKEKETLINETQILKLIANEISAGLQRKRLEEEIKDYAENLEQMVVDRTRQLREKDVQLVQTGKLATLGEMATGIAHEINQPLGGISLITQGLMMAKERRKLTGEMLDQKLKSIKEQIDRINKIINHLRDFSRQSIDVMTSVNINSPLKDVFKLIGQQLKKRKINLELDLDENIPLIIADHNKLEQVFLNLIGNSRDALDEFEIEISNMKKDGVIKNKLLNNWVKHIIIKTYSKGNSVYFELYDSGCGIESDKLEKIFEPFFTTKEAGKGTGLGLTISYNIIKNFNGTIDVVSQKNKGTTFTIKFPKEVHSQS